MGNNFLFETLPLAGLMKITLNNHTDERGGLVELYTESAFRDAGLPHHFALDLISRSRKNVIRGMHYQLQPAAQVKVIRCLQGEIYDVIADLRKSSPTYGKWVGVNLSANEYSMLLLPAGVAHGFVVRSESADLLYKCSAEHSPAHERGIRWNDPTLNIQWDCPSPIISQRDSNLPLLHEADNNFA